MGKLDGKVAIITGAPRGLGKAITLKLTEEGANLLIIDRNMPRLEETKELVESQGGRAVVARVDHQRNRIHSGWQIWL